MLHTRFQKGLLNDHFIYDIINGMYDWVRVVDTDNNVIYMNKAMVDGLNCSSTGGKCYALIGRSSACENCTSYKAIFDGRIHEKEEIIKDRIFSVMSSPIKDDNGNIIAAVEVLRDVTQTRQMQKSIIDQNKKLQADLNLARKLQCSLLPKVLPQDKIEFSFIYKPCETLGGDFVDIFKIDEDHMGIYIADVSGHGVSASMLTVFLRSALNKKYLLPSKALAALYEEYNNNNFDSELYITVFYAILDTKNKTITFSNAGHNVSPVLFNKDKLELLRTPGIPISNWMQSPEYVDKQLGLAKGDRIFFYTDGIIEVKNKTGEQFGEERLLGILLNSTSGTSMTLNALLDSACDFAEIDDSHEVMDDITMALIEVK